VTDVLISNGLSFSFTDEQEMFRQSIRELTNGRFSKEYCREVEAREEFPGISGTGSARRGSPVSVSRRNMAAKGGGIIEQAILDEELSRTMAGLYWLLGITLFDAKAIAAVGTDEQKQRFLPEIAAGRMMFAISMTEPGGGTDVFGAMRTRAKRVDGGWVVNGIKIWSTLAHAADRLFLIARTTEIADNEKSHPGVTVFLCDAKTEGVAATPIPKLGMRSLGSCEIQFDDVLIGDEDVLGEVDQGWRVLADTLNSERIMNGANCSGALAGVLEDMVAYSKERTAFGKPIGQFQAVQHMIADTYMGLETARLLTYRAAWLQANGKPCGIEPTMAKVVASEACFAGADRGMQVLGGYGYAMEALLAGHAPVSSSADQQRDGSQLPRRELRSTALVLMPRVWVSVGFLPEEDVLALAPEIERLGYDGITFPDHVFTPVSAGGRYPYSEDGKPPFALDSPWPDALVLIGAVGARTTTLQLMTAVQILALRHPVLFAKAATTAARICGGRLTVGVGAGWQRDEFEALGVDFGRRGALLDEAIDAVRRLWGEQPAEHRGRHYAFGPLQMEPSPPPISIVTALRPPRWAVPRAWEMAGSSGWCAARGRRCHARAPVQRPRRHRGDPGT
jgi:alkylation response protein AidB-like acyl-CoA dehydrogenase